MVSGRLVRLADFDELRLATTEAHGSEHAVLSLTGARRYHDFLAEQIARHPARFSGFAAVPMRDPTRAAGELRRAGRELGFKGALSNGSKKVEDAAHGRYLDEPDHEQFWTAVDELDVPIYLHPRPGLPGTQVASAGHPRLLGATWGFGAETATHVLRLIFSGLFDRHPDVRMVVGHLGEGLPTLL